MGSLGSLGSLKRRRLKRRSMECLRHHTILLERLAVQRCTMGCLLGPITRPDMSDMRSDVKAKELRRSRLSKPESRCRLIYKRTRALLRPPFRPPATQGEVEEIKAEDLEAEATITITEANKAEEAETREAETREAEANNTKTQAKYSEAKYSEAKEAEAKEAEAKEAEAKEAETETETEVEAEDSEAQAISCRLRWQAVVAGRSLLGESDGAVIRAVRYTLEVHV